MSLYWLKILCFKNGALSVQSMQCPMGINEGWLWWYNIWDTHWVKFLALHFPINLLSGSLWFRQEISQPPDLTVLTGLFCAGVILTYLKDPDDWAVWVDWAVTMAYTKESGLALQVTEPSLCWCLFLNYNCCLSAYQGVVWGAPRVSEVLSRVHKNSF
jgi:hypothetical protein